MPVAFLDHPSVIAEIRKCDLFVIPCLTATNGDKEGTPTVLIGAQACGKPVISTRHADIPEVVQDRRTGYLAEEGSVSSLVEKIEDALMNRNDWPQMGLDGHAYMMEHYNLETETEKLQKVYDEVT